MLARQWRCAHLRAGNRGWLAPVPQTSVSLQEALGHAQWIHLGISAHTKARKKEPIKSSQNAMMHLLALRPARDCMAGIAAFES
jgi:hypothetical protein